MCRPAWRWVVRDKMSKSSPSQEYFRRTRPLRTGCVPSLSPLPPPGSATGSDRSPAVAVLATTIELTLIAASLAWSGSFSRRFDRPERRVNGWSTPPKSSPRLAASPESLSRRLLSDSERRLRFPVTATAATVAGGGAAVAAAAMISVAVAASLAGAAAAGGSESSPSSVSAWDITRSIRAWARTCDARALPTGTDTLWWPTGRKSKVRGYHDANRLGQLHSTNMRERLSIPTTASARLPRGQGPASLPSSLQLQV